MPFQSVKQELWMRRNQPGVWRDWVRRYGHHPGYAAAIKKAAKKAARTRSKKKGGRRTGKGR
jgi:hypothetical protein